MNNAAAGVNSHADKSDNEPAHAAGADRQRPAEAGQSNSIAHARPTNTKRRKLKLGCLDDAVAEVIRLERGGYDRAKNWGLTEVLSHLNKTMGLAFEPHPYLLPAPARVAAKWMMLPLMARGLQLPSGAKAPPDLLPDDDSDVEQAIATFQHLAQQLADPAVELVAEHPLLGKINRQQWLVMQTWHAAHHLSFLVPRIQ